MLSNAFQENNYRGKATQSVFSFTMEPKDTNVRHTLETSNSERDLDIRITNNLKWNQQVKIAANKANNV